MIDAHLSADFQPIELDAVQGCNYCIALTTI